jgi:hypothetical protein
MAFSPRSHRDHTPCQQGLPSRGALRRYLIRDPRIMELHDLSHGQTWRLFRNMNTIAIRADLSEEDRTRAPRASSAQVARERRRAAPRCSALE